MVAALTLFGVLAMICFIICRRVYISYVILNFGCCPLNGLGKFRQSCSGGCQSLSIEMQDMRMQNGQGKYNKSHYNQPRHCNMAGTVLEENFSTEEECGDSQKKEASLWQHLKNYFRFEHSASQDCYEDDITNMRLVDAPDGSNNAEDKTSNDIPVSVITEYPGESNQVLEGISDPKSAVALKERGHSHMEVVNSSEENNLDLTKKTSNNVLVSEYPQGVNGFNHRNQVTEKTKDPKNAVVLRERRRMVKELVLLDENPTPVYDYLVDPSEWSPTTHDRIENEYIVTPIKEDTLLKGSESTESISSLEKLKTLSARKSNPVTLKERKLSSQEIINETKEKLLTQEPIMELKEEHNLFNAEGEKIVVNVRAVVTKE